ncbi:Chemotaxis protein CheY [Aquisphaera giovannonii]|uniref:Chemotaxis protein CheY n=1 Tax=Aquisphaera giovannonii TaxID=406548 RepID=A0A5B9W6E6_9BACT|nr:response regulator [Aquisphaera giovannonii]QEH35794.1 Chemotaxis protein CheY [Aquisphaera giovannonii]
MRVLLVDDMDDLRESSAWLLRLAGCEVRTAPCGDKALADLNGFQPELVLTDFMMPQMDGIELIRRLRSIPELDHVPMLMVTAADDRTVEEQAKAAGAAGIVTKPVDILEVLGRVERGEFHVA